MGELEKQKINNAKREKAGMAALSYGEMMHYESTLKGANDAGSLAAQMKAGHLSVANSSELDGASKYETASREMKVAGGLDAAVNTKATNASKQLGQTQEELRALGIMDNKGNMNLENLRKYNGASGAINAAKEMANDTNYKEFLKENNLNDNPANRDKFANYVGKTQGLKENIDTGVENRVQNVISTDDRKKIDSTENITKSLTNQQIQSLNSIAERVTAGSSESAIKTDTMNKLIDVFGGQKEAIAAISDGDAFRKAVGVKVANEIDKKLGIDSSVNAETRKEMVDKLTQNKIQSTQNQQSTSDASKIDENTKFNLEEAKNIDSNHIQNLPNDMNKLTDDLISKGYSKKDAEFLVAKEFSNNGFHNDELNKKSYDDQMKEIVKEKNKDLEIFNKNKDKAKEIFEGAAKLEDNIKKAKENGTDEKIIEKLESSKEKLKNEAFNLIKKDKDGIEADFLRRKEILTNSFLSNGSASLNDNGTLSFSSTIKDLNSMDKNSTEYQSSVRQIAGNFNALGTKMINGQGYKTEVVTNVLGERISETWDAKRGIAKVSTNVNELGYTVSGSLGQEGRENLGKFNSGIDGLLKVAAFGGAATKVTGVGVSTVKRVANFGGQKASKDLSKKRELQGMDANLYLQIFD